MRYPKIHFKQRFIRIIFIIISLSIATVSFAQDKVVVIPLFESESNGSGALLKATVLNVDCTTDVDFDASYTKIANVGSFTKLDSQSLIELTFNGRIKVSSITGTGAVFEIRIDDNATTNGRARANIKSNETGTWGIPSSITGIFTGLSAGSHTVSFWVRASLSGSGTSARIDPGCWSSDHIVIKEFK